MEIYALNLPQFHRIPENDEWWGEGFTEWVNVKRAKPLYRGHRQPLVPLNNNYYDLSNPETIIQQHNLGIRYGLSGFVYYHYWFNGKLLLQKPIELLRELPEARLHYSLCWANEPWTRAWDGKNREIIQPQTFGGTSDWINHIEYLATYFSDERYQRINGKPVLYIYSAKNIPNCNEMIECWNKWLQKHGYSGIYLIEFLSTFNPVPACEYSDAVFEFEPLYSSHYKIPILKRAKRAISKTLKCLDVIDYDCVWNAILSKSKEYPQRTIIRSGFTNFDNSPRKGGRAFITRGASPEKFEQYLKKLLESNRPGYCDVLLINAWNEWGEGAILEPTEQDGFKWLEAVNRAVGLG